MEWETSSLVSFGAYGRCWLCLKCMATHEKSRSTAPVRGVLDLLRDTSEASRERDRYIGLVSRPVRTGMPDEPDPDELQTALPGFGEAPA